MTRNFFTGGTMPSLDLFLYFQDHLRVDKVTYINGMHYSRCLEAWLALQDKHRRELMPVFVVRDHLRAHVCDLKPLRIANSLHSREKIRAADKSTQGVRCQCHLSADVRIVSLGDLAYKHSCLQLLLQSCLLEDGS